VNSRVAARAPTSALPEEKRVRHAANVDFSRRLVLNLRVTLQAQVGVVLHEQLAIDRTMRVMTHDAAFPERFMLEHERPRLLSMALCAVLVLPSHGKATRTFQDVRSVRIVALHATHAALEDRMMLWQVHLRFDVEVALEAGFRSVPGIDNELTSTAT
jgi:hypothetical protein